MNLSRILLGIFVFPIALVIATSIFALPVARFILLIPVTNDTIPYDEITSRFITVLIPSLVISYALSILMFAFIISDFVLKGKIFRKLAQYSTVYNAFMYNIYIALIVFDIFNILSCVLHNVIPLPNSNWDLYEQSPIISIITINHLPLSTHICSFLFVLIFFISINLYAMYEGHRLSIRHITLVSPKVKEEVRFVHISDIHIGSWPGSHAQRIANMSAELAPQFTVITGDLTDSPKVEASEIMPFAALSDIGPVYMSTGNHDYLTGIEKVEEYVKQAGITLLRNKTIVDETGIGIIGIDDCEKKKEYVEGITNITGGVDDSLYNIVLHHRPHGYKETCKLGKYDLMLAGHTHAGQFVPFSLFVYMAFPKASGLHNIETDNARMKLYTHPGTGAWGSHMRTAGKNLVTVFHIKPLD
ncbi:Calcineurin-like phosphoesterase domain-containing protein [Entamoeba marina]